MQPETRFKIRLRPQLEAIPSSYWIKIQQVTLRGDPDFVGSVGGRFVALELKVPGGAEEALQTYKLAKLRAAGAWCRTVYPRDVERLLKDLKRLAAGG